MLKLDSRQNKPLSSVRFVTHKGKSMKISTTTKHGVMGFRMKQHPSTTDHHLTLNRSKTTKFIPSKPVVSVKTGDEPPF